MPFSGKSKAGFIKSESGSQAQSWPPAPPELDLRPLLPPRLAEVCPPNELVLWFGQPDLGDARRSGGVQAVSGLMLASVLIAALCVIVSVRVTELHPSGPGPAWIAFLLLMTAAAIAMTYQGFSAAGSARRTFYMVTAGYVFRVVDGRKQAASYVPLELVTSVKSVAKLGRIGGLVIAVKSPPPDRRAYRLELERLDEVAKVEQTLNQAIAARLAGIEVERVANQAGEAET